MSTSSVQWRFLFLLAVSGAGHLWPLLGNPSTERMVIPTQEGEISIEVRLSAASVASAFAPAPVPEVAQTPRETEATATATRATRAVDPEVAERVAQSARRLLESVRAAWNVYPQPDTPLVPELTEPTEPAEPVAIAQSEALPQEFVQFEKESEERSTLLARSRDEPPKIERQHSAAPKDAQENSQPKEKVDSPAASPEQAASQSTKPKPVGVRSEARLLGNFLPRYPEEAQRRGIEGTVVLRLHITSDGVVDVATIEKGAGSSLLDDAALDFARSIRFAPARLDQQPVETILRLPVTFRLVAP